MKNLIIACITMSCILPLHATDLRQIEQIATRQCARCHGINGDSIDPMFPRLTGQYQEYLVQQLQKFKSGERKSDAMSHQVKNLSTEEIRLISLFFEAGFSAVGQGVEGGNAVTPVSEFGKLRSMQQIQKKQPSAYPSNQLNKPEK